MKHLLPLAILVTLLACKKETESTPRLTFTQEDKKWFTYHIGNEWKFKNDRGDSLVYRVTQIEKLNFNPEYIDSFRTIVAYSETYYVKLESATDSIKLFFFKELRSIDPDKLQCNILWVTMRGQLINLAAIKDNASFNQKTVNGLTYTTVTPTTSTPAGVAPFTRFDKAYYDQGAGFIEIIDMNGVSWKRV